MNQSGDVVTIAADRTIDGTTLVPGKGTLVVYLEESFLDNDEDTLSLYAPAGLLETLTDDVREDVVSYENVSVLPEGKSFARFPDGEGIWLDPEATPGATNVMTTDEKKQFRRLAFEACFKDEQLDEEAGDTMCSPLFLHFIDMIDDLEDKTLKSSVVLEVLSAIQKEETDKLLALLGEDGVVTPEEQTYATITVPEEPVAEEEVEEYEEASEDEEVTEVLPVTESTPAEPGVEAGTSEEGGLPEETPEVEAALETPVVDESVVPPASEETIPSESIEISE